MDAIQRSVVEVFEHHRDTAYEGASLRPVVGKCPRCGADVIRRGRMFDCTSNDWDDDWNLRSGCGFKLISFSGKRFTEAQARDLLAGKMISLSGCVSKKTGKKFSCKLRLIGDKLEPEFDRSPKRTPRKGRK